MVKSKKEDHRRLLQRYRTLAISFAITTVIFAGTTVVLMRDETPETLIKKPKTNRQIVENYKRYRDSYYGLSESKAHAKARQDGFGFRVIERDGERLPITLDLNPNRINASLSDGKVIGIDDFY